MKVIFIDGSSMLTTAYYGSLPRELMYEKDESIRKQLYAKIMQTSDGVYTNAIYTMVKQLINLFKDQQPTHIIFAFDKTRDTFRKQLYADYKANRGSTLYPLKSQFIDMEKILEQLGFPVLISDNYEADDLIGSAVTTLREELPNVPFYIATKDHDYLQLIDTSTHLWLLQNKQEIADTLNNKYNTIKHTIPAKAFEVTEEICKAEYGVYPNSIPDLKGLVGDSSDNIPGVKGISDKTAVPLLTNYGSIENIYTAVENCKSASDKAELTTMWKEQLGIKRSPINALTQQKDIALLSKQLATMKTDITLDLTEESARFRYNQDKWEAMFNRYEFKSLSGTKLTPSKPKKSLFNISI